MNVFKGKRDTSYIMTNDFSVSHSLEDEIQLNKDIYNKTAEEYDRLITPTRTDQFIQLVNELELTGGEEILELGCGPGRLGVELAKTVCKGNIICTDISEKMLELTRKKLEKHENAKICNETAHSLTFENEKFHTVVASQLLVRTKHPKKILQEVHRVLKNKGKLALITATKDDYKEFSEAIQKVTGEIPQTDLSKYTKEEINMLLKEHGFEIKKQIEIKKYENIPTKDYVDRMCSFRGDILFPTNGLTQKLFEELDKTPIKSTENSVITIAEKIA